MNNISKLLIDIKAIQVNTKEKFVWASGIISPIYIDNRLIMSFPKIRNHIMNKLSEVIKNKFPDINYIIGVATGAISHAAYISNILNIPMGYVRIDDKKHGKRKKIEGNISKKDKIVVIDDLLSTGQSALKAINILKMRGYNVIGLASIFSYETKILKNTLKDISYISLVKLDDILNDLLNQNYINDNELLIVNNFIHKL